MNIIKENSSTAWTTIRVSRAFKKWLDSQGDYKTDASAFSILCRLLGWKPGNQERCKDKTSENKTSEKAGGAR